MSCVSTDDPNFLPAGKKVVGHYMSGVSACSQYDVHKVTSMPGLDAGGAGLDSTAGHLFGPLQFASLYPRNIVDSAFC